MASPTPAKSSAPPSKPAPAPAPSPRPAPAPSARQAGGPAVRLGPDASGGDTAPGVLELKGMGDAFKPPEAIGSFLDGRKAATVNARFGRLAQGPVQVKTEAKGKYRVRDQRMPLSHPLFARLAESVPGLEPCLVINVENNALKGHVGLAAGAKLDRFDDHLKKAPEILGLMGFSLGALPAIVNNIEGGSLHLGLNSVPITLGQAFSGTFTLVVVDESVTFDGSANVNVKGLASGNLALKRGADGLITGKATVGLNLPKNISGSVDVAWDGQAVTGEGKVGYTGEKLSGEVILRLMEKGEAARLEAEKKAPEGAPKPAAAKPGKSPKGQVEYAVFGEGDLTFAFTDWMNGTAHVIVDPKGFVTIIGKITPQKEFILFTQKDYERQLFKVEARASYGLPVVGNIFIFANVSMNAFATLGPGKFYNIVVEGTYSTDPEKAKSFSIRGSLNVSAAAGLKLRGEAGAGLEILAHDIKAGAGVNGIAGIKGYAEATPIVGYREKAAPGQDKKGECFIRGELEIAAQPFLGLSGDLFVEVDAPWWSPVPDKKWTWPLGGKEWPIGGSLGVGASVDYVFGSNEWPKLDFKPVDFDSSKFMSDLYSDKAKSGSGKDKESKGKWAEKNSKTADPPPKKPPVGNAKPGKGATPPPAKSKVQPGGGKGAKPADPNAKTAEGKTVKQHQDEATKKGKKPAGGDVKAGGGKEAPAAKGKDKGKEQDPEKAKKLTAGLAAIDKTEEAYKKDGKITREDAEKVAVKVKKEHPVFKVIKVVDGGTSWDYEYEASPKDKKKGEEKSSKGAAGSEKAPFAIVWHKRPIANYTAIWLAPADVVTKGRVYKQAKLKTMQGAQEFSPTGRRKVFDADSIGVTGNWRTVTDKKYGPAPHTGRVETEKERFNDLLKRHGYDRETGTNEGTTDGDHVSELQMVGAAGDTFPNLWPLYFSENRSSGSKLSQTKVKLDDGSEKAIRGLAERKYWFQIKSFSR